MSNKTKPKHEQLKEEILGWIQSGRYKPNDQLPTEHEIADLSGMSRQTVRQSLGSLVQEGWLNRKRGSGTYVSGRPDRKASDAPSIGVITTYISDYIFPQIVQGTESVLRAGGYHMIVSSTDNDKAKERENLVMLRTSAVQGLIIEPTKSALGNPNLDCYLAFDYFQIPYIMLNERYAELDCPCVKVDDERGGYLAAKHLIELGHRQIAGFFKTDDLQGTQRLRGFLRAHHDLKIPVLPESVVHYTTENKRTKPYEQAQEMLSDAPSRPTGFVCYNDELAVLLLEAARQMGLRVPDDLSVVGFDDSFLATATEIKLTTVTHPKAELGARAAEMLIHMVEGKVSGKIRDVVFQPELIVRDSTKAFIR
ncbi:MAG: GntR family transcriptional regulator [Cohnella sp.]|nr:GntR family transcriptional regulator [Cohnella sp.]